MTPRELRIDAFIITDGDMFIFGGEVALWTLKAYRLTHLKMEQRLVRVIRVSNDTCNRGEFMDHALLESK